MLLSEAELICIMNVWGSYQQHCTLHTLWYKITYIHINYEETCSQQGCRSPIQHLQITSSTYCKSIKWKVYSSNGMSRRVHLHPIGYVMSIFLYIRWWKGVMVLRRRWSDLTHFFAVGPRLRYTFDICSGGRWLNLLLVAMGVDVRHGWESTEDLKKTTILEFAPPKKRNN